MSVEYRFTDLRQVKRDKRAHFKALRAGISPGQKAEWDAAIAAHIIDHPAYREAHTLLAYMPTPGEIDTRPLLEHAWVLGKRVALPHCLPDAKGVMEFYLVGKGDPLTRGIHRSLEPDPSRQEKLVDFTGCLCLVPGYAFDAKGYRLGYGGGYYDRFLSKARGTVQTIGAYYSICTAQSLPLGRYDQPCGYLVTEAGVRAIGN